MWRHLTETTCSWWTTASHTQLCMRQITLTTGEKLAFGVGFFSLLAQWFVVVVALNKNKQTNLFLVEQTLKQQWEPHVYWLHTYITSAELCQYWKPSACGRAPAQGSHQPPLMVRANTSRTPGTGTVPSLYFCHLLPFTLVHSSQKLISQNYLQTFF